MKAKIKSILKENIYIFIGIIGICAIFSLVFYFYSIPVAAVVYPSILSLFFVAILVTVKYRKEYEKKEYIGNLKNQPATTVCDLLPVADSVLEAEYIELIKESISELTKEISEYEKNERDMKDYYAIWAHQIKTPIASMRLKLQSMDSKEARILLTNVKSVESYVDMVMTYIRLNSDHTDFVFAPEDLSKLVMASVKKFSVDFIEKKLTFSMDVKNAEIITDKKWLSIIIEQIISNSLKYTVTGGITITYDDKERALSIADTGIGIDKANLPRIFENGYTGFNGRQEAHSSGIGLYISKRIADGLGIELKCDSKEGEGTKMTLVFPKKAMICE